jgi:drug/metabolite transporter (DMT)-like permease
MLGELSALSASFSWSLGISCLARASRRIGVLAANHVRMTLGVVFLILAKLVFFDSIFPSLSNQTWFFLALSGVTGYFLADFCLVKSCVTLSTRLGFLLFSLSPIMSAVIGWTFYHEHLKFSSCLGIVVTLAGICVVIMEKSDDGRLQHKKLFLGILFGVLAAFWQAVGSALAKSGMIGTGTADPLSANLIRAISGGLAFYAVGAAQGRSVTIFKTIGANPRSVGLISIASLVGLAFGTWLYMVALKTAPIAIATTLASTLPVTVLPFSYLIDRERISARAILGAVITCVGIGVLFLV